jgi:hypothetical protein
MRNVLRNHQEVAHVWAQRSQESGKAGNMFFEGESIYSYGRHFEIARHVSGAVLFTTASYSNSTAKHKNYTRRAVSHLTVFTVPSMFDHKANAEAYLKAVDRWIAEARKSIYSGYRIDAARNESREAMRYARHFKKGVGARLFKKIQKQFEARWFTPREVAAMRAKEEKYKAGKDARQEARRSAEQARYARTEARRRAEVETFNLWGEEIEALTAEAFRNGQSVPRDSWSYDAPVLLRLIEDGKTIETSQGAYVPTEHARGLWTLIQKGSDIKDIRIGSYKVSGVHDGKLVIGCHKIPLREVARMAFKLGLEGGLR